MYQTSEKPIVRIAEFSAEWEGRTIDGAFPLRQFLGAGESSAVFLTTYETRSAAIKLLSIEAESGEKQLSRWQAAAKLSHPNLVRIFTTGRCELDDAPLFYVVMEHAEENLSQVLPDRSLTAVETREMLEPTLNALAYLHQQGFVHAHLKPANIMAVNDCLKISSDNVRMPRAKDEIASSAYGPPERIFSPAGDVWSLGVTLVEILTQNLPADGKPPADLPEPFGEIARGCLEPDVAKRWTIAQVSQRLSDSGGGSAAMPPRKRRKIAPIGVIILLALLVVIVTGVMIRLSESETPPAQQPVAPVATTPEPPASPPETKPEPKKESKKALAKAPEPVQSEPEAKQPPPAKDVVADVPASGIVSQPLPDILDQARNTIRGRVRVTLRVDVDPAGNVTDAKLDSPGTNKYFGERAMAAARQWKFEPVKVNGSDVGQRWRLRFEFYRTGTKVQPQRVSP